MYALIIIIKYMTSQSPMYKNNALDQYAFNKNSVVTINKYKIKKTNNKFY